MNLRLGIIVLLAVPSCCNGQATLENISPSRLQAILDLPLSKAVEERAIYKVPLKSAYQRQITMSDKDCAIEANQGQQPYNICIGKADEQADRDYATFYNNLQLLCRDQDQLRTLQSSEQAWRAYLNAMEKARHASWPEGTGAPGFASDVHLFLMRSRMRELYKIYALNIAQ